MRVFKAFNGRQFRQAAAPEDAVPIGKGVYTYLGINSTHKNLCQVFLGWAAWLSGAIAGNFTGLGY